jgi:hypothetical protein
MVASSRVNCSRSAACCLRNLSHPDEFILLAQVPSKGRSNVQIDEVHGPPQQFADVAAITL